MNQSQRRACHGVLASLFSLAILLILTAGNQSVIAEEMNGPDLSITSVSWTPQLPTPGNTVLFTVYVVNQGDDLAGSSRLSYFIDNNYQSSEWLGQITPDTIVSRTVNWKALAGPHVFKAVVDYDNSIYEVDENNNEKSIAFSVIAPDLVVTSINWVPLNPSVGDTVNFMVTVKNQGDNFAAGSSVSLSIDGSPRGNRGISWVEGGENTTATFSWQATAGTHNIEASADFLNQVKEGDETNNSLSVNYTTAAPDLTINSITWAPQNRSETSNVTLTVEISNQGSGKSTGCWLAFFVDDVFKQMVLVDPLKAGASQTKSYSWIAGASSHLIKVIVDYHGEVVENDEDNNSLTELLPPILPDLIIQSITCSSDKPLIAHQVVFYVTVKNQGLCTCPNSDLDLYISETTVLHTKTPILVAGNTVSLPFFWVTQADSLTLEAVIDPANLISETNENNNTRTVNIGFSGRTPDTDLSIESIAWAPVNPPIGDVVTITANIKNSGPGTADPFHVDYYIDNNFLESVYSDHMESGKTAINTTSWKAEPGRHIIRAIVDSNNSVFETDENNNEKTAIIVNTAPDLVIREITWSPPVPKAGDEISFNVTLENCGDMKADDFFIGYYIDNNAVGKHYIDFIEPGMSISRNFTWRAQADILVFRVCLDETDNVNESNDSNNEKTLTLPAPDLNIESITWNPENPTDNETVTFNVALNNSGTGPALLPCVNFYINNSLLSAIQFNRVGAGETASGACTWLASTGNWSIAAIADEADVLVENCEDNNNKTAELEVISKPDEVPIQNVTSAPQSNPDITENITEDQTEKIKAMLFEEVTDDNPTKENINDTSPSDKPIFQKILTNRLFVVGVAGIGMLALVILIILRRRAPKK